MQTDPSVSAPGTNPFLPNHYHKAHQPIALSQTETKAKSCARNSVSAVPGKPDPYNGPRADVFPWGVLCPCPAGLGQSHDPTRLVSLPNPKSYSVLAELYQQSDVQPFKGKVLETTRQRTCWLGLAFFRTSPMSWGNPCALGQGIFSLCAYLGFSTAQNISELPSH